MSIPIYLETGNQERLKIFEFESPITGIQLREKLYNVIGTYNQDFFVKFRGRLVDLDAIIYHGELSLVPKLCGGKGGFGSMLRAIGAQIEKTTNREACRDLSGRRLRDINKEKRLKSWIEKQSERKEEAAEKKKKKLERLCAEPRHEFKDKSYEEKRSGLTERVGDAVEEGFAVASTSTEKRKIKHEVESIKKKKKKTIMDSDDDSSSDSDTSDEGQSKTKKKIDSHPFDSENSSETHSSDQKNNQTDENSMDSSSINNKNCQTDEKSTDDTSR